MCTKFRTLYYYLVILIYLVNSFIMITLTYAQKPEDTIYWTIETPKKTYYPGEAVPLTLNIKNNGKQQEKVDFGSDGLEAFLMKIRDSNNTIVVKGDKILRDGMTRIGTLDIGLNETGKKTVVLNRWCSTILPPGKYYISSLVEYRLRSEATKKPNTSNTYLPGPTHQIQLDCNIELIKPEPNTAKCKEILDNLSKYEIENNQKPFNEWKQERELAREMIVFTEWEIAAPYQINVLKTSQYTWMKRDAINSLAKSNTLNTVNNLITIVENSTFEDVKGNIVEAVYKIREKGNKSIINATEEFVKKYKRTFVENPITK
jgi:hypothetical protein